MSCVFSALSRVQRRGVVCATKLRPKSALRLEPGAASRLLSVSMSDPRPRLSAENLDPRAFSELAAFHTATVTEVQQLVQAHRVVVVGMRLNPFVKKARSALQNAGIEYHYHEVGGYFSEWKPRLAIKMWSGWPTFPQIFVEGRLLGGAAETMAALSQGELKNSSAK